MFMRNANPGATEAELLARDRLAHALMYFSRGNPVVYYGDEQGFTGAGGDQDARQDMFPSQDLAVQQPATRRDDGAARTTTSAPTRRRWTTTSTRGTRSTRRSRSWRRSRAATRRCATAPSSTATRRRGRGRLRVLAHRPRAPARVRRRAEQRRAARVGVGPDLRRDGAGRRSTATGRAAAQRPRRRLDVTVGPLSTASTGRRTHPAQPPGAVACRWTCRRTAATGSRSRADVGGDSFDEVTFLAKVGHGGWQDIGTDDNAPYRVFHDVADVAPGTTRPVPRGRARQRAATRARAPSRARPSRRRRSRSRRRTRASASAARSRCARPRCPTTRPTS